MNPPIKSRASVWSTTAQLPELSPLEYDITVDVCVIGAGISGLSTAYLLSLEGKSVAVVEDGTVGSGQTARTTAHLSCAFDDRYCDLIRTRGEHIARLAAESHATAIDQIELNVINEKIDCDFCRLDGYLFQPPESSASLLARELKATQEIGLPGVTMVDRAPLPEFDTGPCLKFERQGQFHPLKYLNGLVEAIFERGNRIYTGTHVTKVKGGDGAYVQTQRGLKISANAIVVATNSPINDTLVIHSKQAPYITYVIGCLIPASTIAHSLYWDTLDAYHYVRLQIFSSAQDLLIVGGEDHKQGQSTNEFDRWQRLLEWTKVRFPIVEKASYRWSGVVMESTDGLAFIGKNPLDDDNVFIVTGDSGMGMTHGTIASMLLRDLILERENPWLEVYDPSRKPLWGMAGQRFLGENINVAGQYLKDWLGPGEVSNVDDIIPGSGAVLRKGLGKTAAYRAADGSIHTFSASCPHLGCIVHWNSEEKCWDCPCHGSRFDPYGAVISGPAHRPLKRLT